MTDECPKCKHEMKRSTAKLNKGLVRRRCHKCGETDFAWLTIAEMAKSVGAKAGQARQVVAALYVEETEARGAGEERQFSPEIQAKVFAELRRRDQDEWSGWLAGSSRNGR
jgi:hypothetical protein